MAYGASKHAVMSISAQINMQEGGNGIRSCAICPGEVATPILDRRPVKLTPEELEKLIQPEDIAEAGFRAGAGVQEAECLVDMVEPAGADTYVVSELGGKQVTARLHAETSAQAGQTLNLAFDMSKVSYFAKETGERLN